MRDREILSRDPWFGLTGKTRFDEFLPWWHRTGKKGLGRDLMSRQEALDAYDEWDRAHPPRAGR